MGRVGLIHLSMDRLETRFVRFFTGYRKGPKTRKRTFQRGWNKNVLGRNLFEILQSGDACSGLESMEVLVWRISSHFIETEALRSTRIIPDIPY